MIEYKGRAGLKETRVYNADFWLVGLFCVQTEETMSGKLSWISGDEDNAWFDALDHAALNLIRQYAIMAVNLTKQDIYSVLLRDILRTVQTFE